MSTSRRVLLVVLLILLAGYLVWLAVNRSGITPREVITAQVVLLFTLSAAAACVWIAIRSEPLKLRLAWLAYALGLALLAAEAVRATLQTFGTNPGFNLSDPLRLGMIALLIAGALLHPRPRQPRLNSMPVTLDLLIAVIAASASAFLAVEPLRGLFFDYLPVLSYAGLGYGLLCILLLRFLTGDPRYQPIHYDRANLALVCFALSAICEPLLMQLSTSFLPNLIPALWAGGAYLFVMAAFYQYGPGLARLRRGQRAIRRMSRVQTIVPHMIVLLMVVVAAINYFIFGLEQQAALWIFIILSMLIIARQIFRAGQIRFQQYANLVNSIAEPAFVCDENGLLQLVNPALLAATSHVTPSSLLGKPLSSILPEDTDAGRMLDRAMAIQIQPGDTIPLGWSGETFLRRRDGNLIPVYLSLRPVQGWDDLPDSSSATLAVAGTAHDLTVHKEQQAALRRTYEQLAHAHAQLETLNAELEQKVAEETANLSRAYRQLEEQNRALQTLDRLKSDFVSLVSHELRSPLTNISGGIELVLSRFDPLEPGVRRNLELVQAEILRLTRFVETILDLSALDAGRLPLYPAPVSYESIVSGLQNQLLHLPGLARIRWQAQPDLPFLLADERALTSVLFHLLDNAMKYAPSGQITVQARVDDGLACIEVCDEGPGIPPDALPLLFDRFYRSDNADSQTVYGHGLGLYIVRRLMEGMGGRVEVANRQEGGAVFTCWLKLAETLEEHHAL